MADVETALREAGVREVIRRGRELGATDEQLARALVNLDARVPHEVGPLPGRKRRRNLKIAGVLAAVLAVTLPFYIHAHNGFHRYSDYTAGTDPPKEAIYPERCNRHPAPYGEWVRWTCPNYPWPIAGD